MLQRSWPLTGLLLLVACGPKQWEPTLHGTTVPGPPGEHAPFLNAHLLSGDVVGLVSWSVPGAGSTHLQGYGVRFGPDRVPGTARDHRIPMDSIALLESNRETTVSEFAFTGLVAWTAVSTVTTAVCVSDPKGCFGSCPTFYVKDAEGAESELVAEGFSASFARVLEATDLDALPPVRSPEPRFSVLMRNEAPETHAVRTARVLAAPRPPEGSLFATADGRFLTGLHATAPVSCTTSAESGKRTCLEAVGAVDGREYFSEADSVDLAAREDVSLEFEAPDGTGPLGLVVKGRAGLLSTFLFYQTIAYLGEDAGRWLAALERGDSRLVERALGMARELGDVEILMERDGAWLPVGRFGEPGPIASDEQVVPLGSDSDGPVRLRLRMARGAWRIDGVRLVRLGDEVEAVRIEPSEVEPVDAVLSADDAKARLLDPDEHLVTRRGEEYRLHYDLPAPASEMALFLETRGYYYEWMRGEWAGEEDPAMAALIFTQPREALRRMAPQYKSLEAGMEDAFWSSRFRRDDR